MYLISAYFDEQTNKQLSHYINQIANKTGNTFMTENRVPPHITISSMETNNEEALLSRFGQLGTKLPQGFLQFVSVGTFFPYVIYVTPVLNAYLQTMAEEVYQAVIDIDGIKIGKYYQPMQWFPHVTLGKTLSKEEMSCAFEIMQNCFVPFEGKLTSVSLARTKPYKELAYISL